MPYQRFLISVLRECQFSRDTVPDQIENKLFKNLNEALGKKTPDEFKATQLFSSSSSFTPAMGHPQIHSQKYSSPSM